MQDFENLLSMLECFSWIYLTHNGIFSTTYVKISQLVASRSTSLEQLFDNSWRQYQTRYNVVLTIVTRLSQSWQHMAVIILFYDKCIYHSYWNNLVISLMVPSSLLQVVNSLFQTCCNNLQEAVRIQLANSLWIDLLRFVWRFTTTCAFLYTLRVVNRFLSLCKAMQTMHMQ